MKNFEANRTTKSKRVMPLLFASSIALAACAGNEVPASPTPDTMHSDVQSDASAQCKSIELRITDVDKRIVSVKTEHVLVNGATYEDTTYIFEADKNPVTVPASVSPIGETTYDYPDLDSEQTYRIQAIIDYSEPNSMKVFGSTAMCGISVTFK